jgi:hypothetical protein
MRERHKILKVPSRGVKHEYKNVADSFMTYASARATPPEV